MSRSSLPPGNMGLPLVGETLSFISNVFGFLETRQKQYGNIFKSNVLGRNVVFLAGTEGAEAFYNEENISRSQAHPPPVVDLFGGINTGMLDGAKHFALKFIELKAFDHSAIATYLPDLQQLMESGLSRMAQSGEFSAIAELRRISIQCIWNNVLGSVSDDDTETIVTDYGSVLRGFVSLPVPITGTPYARARAARKRLFARIKGVIRQRRAQPENDGISRLLTTKGPDDVMFTDDEAVLEVHHMVIAGFIVYGLLAESIRQLAEQPELRTRCRREVQENALVGPLTLETLSKLQTCTNVILEAKRYVPLVPFAFGRAKREFFCSGFQIPAGWMTYLALSLNNKDRAIYKDPDRFDPDRFRPERAEHRKHPMAFIPQGAEPPSGHRCLGLDYSTFLGVAFMAVLLRDYDWELPPQDFSYNWKTLPPEPRDGLRVRLRARK